MGDPARDLVSIENLRVELDGRAILRGVNAALKRGSITALIGLNGSGKTTMLRALLKEYPYTGSVRFHCGHDHRQQRPDRVGYVPQKLTIDARLPITVRDLLSLALQRMPIFWGVAKPARERIDRCLDRVGASRLIDSQVVKLSGGELQRVLLGLALEPEPELLLLDEPAAGIDFKDQDTFYELISRINRESKVTVLLVSHELNVVSRHADHVLCLSEGVIHCQGSPTEVLSDESLKATFGEGKSGYGHGH